MGKQILLSSAPNILRVQKNDWGKMDLVDFYNVFTWCAQLCRAYAPYKCLVVPMLEVVQRVSVCAHVQIAMLERAESTTNGRCGVGSKRSERTVVYLGVQYD